MDSRTGFQPYHGNRSVQRYHGNFCHFMGEGTTRRPTAATCWRMLRFRRSIKAVLIETVAREPGCPQPAFIVYFGASHLSEEGNPMFGPGAYRPDPSEGITAPAALP